MDESLDHETPRFLRRSIELLVNKGIVAKEEVPFQIALSAGDIEDLANLRKGYFSESNDEGGPQPILAFTKPRQVIG